MSEPFPRLRRSAATIEESQRSLLGLLDTGDRLARMLSLHSLSTTPGHATDQVLVAALDEQDLCEHAAWALSRREPVPEAVPALTRIVARGGFAAAGCPGLHRGRQEIRSSGVPAAADSAGTS